MRANENKLSEQAKRRECLPHNLSRHSVLCSLQYVPQLTHGKQIGNRKLTYWKNKVDRVKQTIK